ncbi:hypothetical protein K488DRAFT_71885 [Vararia minispora EC-137]|uniref:Uncharacterized protein n=1 Tax=Vararia minispora EC-137 TaxID=1314806 RepID=A0ACB8QG85_9AGAM|nr:hypothetical protein K488DRAFT_71885 [Vararia minispora EC-137]
MAADQDNEVPAIGSVHARMWWRARCPGMLILRTIVAESMTCNTFTSVPHACRIPVQRQCVQCGVSIASETTLEENMYICTARTGVALPVRGYNVWLSTERILHLLEASIAAFSGTPFTLNMKAGYDASGSVKVSDQELTVTDKVIDRTSPISEVDGEMEILSIEESSGLKKVNSAVHGLNVCSVSIDKSGYVFNVLNGARESRSDAWFASIQEMAFGECQTSLRPGDKNWAIRTSQNKSLSSVEHVASRRAGRCMVMRRSAERNLEFLCSDRERNTTPQRKSVMGQETGHVTEPQANPEGKRTMQQLPDALGSVLGTKEWASEDELLFNRRGLDPARKWGIPMGAGEARLSTGSGSRASLCQERRPRGLNPLAPRAQLGDIDDGRPRYTERVLEAVNICIARSLGGIEEITRAVSAPWGEYQTVRRRWRWIPKGMGKERMQACTRGCECGCCAPTSRFRGMPVGAIVSGTEAFIRFGPANSRARTIVEAASKM